MNSNEIKEYFKEYKNFKDVVETTIKEENICTYSKVADNGRYYATRFFNRVYNETIGNENESNYSVSERDSYLYDFELEDVENIDFEYRQKEQTLLNRVEYDEAFWNTFYKRNIGGKENKKDNK